MSNNRNQPPHRAASVPTNAVGAMSPSQDPRVAHNSDPEGRGSRAAEDQERANDVGTALTLEQQIAMIRSEFSQEALPKVPPVPGWHFCWLSTTNSYDPIHKRIRIGYVPVRADEVKGLASMRMNAGEFEGCISCNEMVLFKIPRALYEAIMTEFHHNMPLQEEEALKQALVTEDQDRTGRKLGQVTEDSDGFDHLVNKRVPKFA